MAATTAVPHAIQPVDMTSGSNIIPIGATPATPATHRMQEIFSKNAPPVKAPPKEKCSCGKVMKVVVLVVIFPLGILWIIQKLAAIALFALGNCIFRCKTGFDLRQYLLPSLCRPIEHTNPDKKAAFLADPANRATTLTMTTPDGVTLDGMILWSEASWEKRFENPKDFNFQQSHWAILYNGNTMLYEDMFEHPKKLDEHGQPVKGQDGKPVYETTQIVADQLREQYQRAKPEAKPGQVDLGMNLVVFNYRGTGNSGTKDGKKVLPNSVSDLILDGHTPIQMLKDKGVPANNLFIEGVSLGGGISVPSAAHHPGVHVGNIHSFTTFPKCIQGIVYDRTSKKVCKCAAKVLAYISSSILAWLLDNNHWNWDSETKWSRLTGYRRIDTALDDELMFPGYGCLSTSTKIGRTVLIQPNAVLKRTDTSHTIEYRGDHAAVFVAIQQRRAYFVRILTDLGLLPQPAAAV